MQLKVGRRIGQLVFAKMDHSAWNPYRGKYQGQKDATQGQKDATGLRVFWDNEIISHYQMSINWIARVQVTFEKRQHILFISP